MQNTAIVMGLAFLLASGCGAESEAREIVAAQGMLLQVGDSTARAGAENDKVLVGPTGSVSGGELAWDRFLSELQAAQPIVDLSEAHAELLKNDYVDTPAGLFELRIDPVNGTVVFRDMRGYAAELTTSTPASDQSLVAATQKILSALDQDGAGHRFDVRDVAESGMARDGTSLGTKKIGRKVFVQRQVGGIAVHGDKLVFTYTMDGDLRKVLGKWRRVDLSNSRLETSLAESEVMKRASEVLAARGVSVGPQSQPVWVRTRYKVLQGLSGSELELTGFLWISSEVGQGVVAEFGVL